MRTEFVYKNGILIMGNENTHIKVKCSKQNVGKTIQNYIDGQED